MVVKEGDKVEGVLSTNEQVGALLALARPRDRKEDGDTRKARNASLRSQIDRSSNEAIVFAACCAGVGLIEEAFVGRLKVGADFPLPPLFKYVNDVMLPAGIMKKGRIRLFDMIADIIERGAATATFDEVTELVDHYMHRIIDRDTNLIETMLLHRNDVEQVFTAVRQKVATRVYPGGAPEGHVISNKNTEDGITSIKSRMEIIRKQREQPDR